jgi:myotubularin-related protein 1/2
LEVKSKSYWSNEWVSYQIYQKLIFNRRSSEDEKMFVEIGRNNPNINKVLIIDARSQVAAFANKAKGGGYENEQNYSNCSLLFGCIDNIHSVRD